MTDTADSYCQKLKRFHKLSLELISLAEKGTLITGYLRDASQKILDFSKAERLNTVVNDIKNHYRFVLEAGGNWNVFLIPDREQHSVLLSEKNSGATPELLEKIVFAGMLADSPQMTEGGGLYVRNASEPIKIRTKTQEKRDNITVRLAAGPSTILILPIRKENETIGVISLEWNNHSILDENEISLYQYIFDIVGSARSHRQAKFHLGERIKELTTIYQITRLGAEINKSLDDVFSGAVDLIPPGFLWPEFACCRIVYANEEFKSRTYVTPMHTMKEEIMVGGKTIGFVEVGYTREQASLDKGPFLREEQPMLMTIARELGLIAERKLFQDERERLQQQLLHADRLVTVGQLTAGVAHELNEPLGGILGFAQLIKKYGDINESVEKDIDKIINASLHAREIIRKLMLFSRQSPPEKKLFSINERINDGLYLLESRLKKSNIRLIKEFSDELPMIRIDPSQFNQVLVNIVVNAIQAMPDGGTLTIKTGKSINTIALTVKDTGTGMTPEQIDKIFIPFFTTKGINEGTGLGLPVALGIVQSHGGSITVQSEPGKGSLFTVKFPIDSEPGIEEGAKNGS